MPNRVILAGDSAGGNLCVALTGLAIKYGYPVCDGLLLAYPVLDLKMKYSPSHQKGLTDCMLSHTVMDICINAYNKNKDSDPCNDCFMSPVLLPQDVILPLTT
jgi:hormone-sensitive lipase